MTLRLFSGVIVLRHDEPGKTSFSNEHYTDWCSSKEAAIGAWVEHAMAKKPGWSVSFQGCYDITDIALQHLVSVG